MIFPIPPYHLIGVGLGAVHRIPDTIRGKHYWWPTGQIENARLPTDSLGTFTLRLKNIVRGSRYRVEVASTGALIDALGEGTVAAGTGETTDVDLTLPYYAAGNANNDLRIKVRKGTSSPFYKDFETLATSQSGTVIAYIGQISDE